MVLRGVLFPTNSWSGAVSSWRVIVTVMLPGNHLTLSKESELALFHKMSNIKVLTEHNFTVSIYNERK